MITPAYPDPYKEAWCCAPNVHDDDAAVGNDASVPAAVRQHESRRANIRPAFVRTDLDSTRGSSEEEPGYPSSDCGRTECRSVEEAQCRLAH